MAANLGTTYGMAQRHTPSQAMSPSCKRHRNISAPAPARMATWSGSTNVSLARSKLRFQTEACLAGTSELVWTSAPEGPYCPWPKAGGQAQSAQSRVPDGQWGQSVSPHGLWTSLLTFFHISQQAEVCLGSRCSPPPPLPFSHPTIRALTVSARFLLSNLSN